MKKQIVNIINFVRGTEPRYPADLLGTMQKQMEELKRLGLKGTFLFQYDALNDASFVQTAKLYSGLFEFGLWIELTRGCVLAAGEAWRGRDQEWDWRGNICNTVGYTPKSRKRLTDAAMSKFKEAFGYFPKSVGAWAIDAVTLGHLEKKYNISAACNCKEQWGTDGYTLWGGYYGQGYYPSKYNSLCPAQTDAAQINIPVFRMLGSDPVYQYDAGLNISGAASECQPVITLEPVYTGESGFTHVGNSSGGGGVPGWVDWYFKENFNGKCLSFGYAQAGQENSFGWDAMKGGWLYQMEKIKRLSESGELSVMTLGETGEWYKNNFKSTPPSAITAESDWKGLNRKSNWYCCKNYRANLFFDGNAFWLRDFFLFDENYKERYLDKICETEGYVFDNLPIIDGNRWSGNGIRAGIYPVDLKSGGPVLASGAPVWTESGGTAVVIIPTARFGSITITFSEDGITVSVEKNGGDNLILKPLFNTAVADVQTKLLDNNTLRFTYYGHKYALKLSVGKLIAARGGFEMYTENGNMRLNAEIF